ncbi:MAG: hypothetical protein KI790_05245 [Cyclobacteriaceae bacterium]|nr:hypothetical protein [Cyclobacteriaceae bacterium HetDA_MAG_MS6]
MMTNTTANMDDQLLLDDVSVEEEALFTECIDNILRNVDRNLERPSADHNKISKLLTMRWLLRKQLVTEE